MNVDEMTIGQVRELSSLIGCGTSKSHSLKVGDAVFVRTVTTYFTGRIQSITDSDMVLTDAAWIASTGRLHDCLRDGTFDEVEPWPDGMACILSRDPIIDATPWPHELPRVQK